VSEFFDVPYPNVLEAQLLFGFPSQPFVRINNIANFIFKVSNQGFHKVFINALLDLLLEGRLNHFYSKALLVPDFLFLDSFIIFEVL
jgi:hypothetical protein